MVIMVKNESSSNQSGNMFTGRIAGWSARHRWKVVIATIVLLVVAVLLSSSFGVETSDVFGAGEAQKAEELLEDRFDIVDPVDELILFHNPNVDVDDPDFHAVVDSLVSELRTYHGVNSVYSYYDTGSIDMISADRHVLMARLEFEPAEEADLEKWVEPVMNAVDEANDGLTNTSFEVSMLGGTSANVAFGNLIDDEFSMILMVALSAGFIVLLLTFGSPIAALIPLLLALAAIFAAIGLAVPVSRIQPLNFYYYEMIMLIGLAVGVDYSLFIINRFREEREALKPKLNAITMASNTTGRAVFYAGLTVVASVAGLLITGDSLFLGLGIGAMIVVFFAIIASLTLLPAFLSILGDRVNMWRIKGLGRPSHGGGVWGFITDRVLARPVVFATLTLAILIAAAIPVFWLHIGSTPVTSETVPEKMEGYRALQLLEDHFGGTSELVSLYVVVDPGKNGTVDTTEIQSSVDALIGRLEQDDTFFIPPFDTQVNEERNLLVVTAPRLGSEDESQGKAAVERLRDEHIPAVFSNSSDVDVLVTGGAAYTVDAANNVKSKAPYVFTFVLGLAFLLLMITFRSIIIPIKAIILNLISVGAAYGILILVFQEGVVGESLLDFKAVGIIEIFMPLFLFAVLFGLSMDYHMLVLSRIKEAYDGGHSNEASVSRGIKATAALITSAAAIMILVFGAFALSSAMFMKQMGFGLGVAVLIDATLIRAILLPASMKLLGDWNWYLPGWLEWLPHISSEVEPTTTAVTPAEIRE